MDQAGLHVLPWDMTHPAHMESAAQLSHVAALQVRVKNTVSVAQTPKHAIAQGKNLNVEIEYKSVPPGGIAFLGPIPGHIAQVWRNLLKIRAFGGPRRISTGRNTITYRRTGAQVPNRN